MNIMVVAVLALPACIQRCAQLFAYVILRLVMYYERRTMGLYANS